jgi:hypothetical protein
VNAFSAEKARFGVEPADAGRLWALSTLSLRSVRTGWLARTGRTYAWSIALCYAVLIAFVPRGEPETAAGLVMAALSALSWSAGLVAWGSARDLDAEETASGLSALAASRGASVREQRLARAVATLRVVASTVGRPAFLLATWALARSTSFHAALAAMPLVLGVVGYALLFGGVVGGLSRAAAWLTPRYGRTLFALAVLAPLAVGNTLSDGPGIVSGFSRLIEQVSTLGPA